MHALDPALVDQVDDQLHLVQALVVGDLGLRSRPRRASRSRAWISCVSPPQSILLSLLEANLGAALMPETARSGNNLRGVSVDGLDLRRPVSLYAVAGRERSAAATGLMKLLRAADWVHRHCRLPRSQRNVSAGPVLEPFKRRDNFRWLHPLAKIDVDLTHAFRMPLQPTTNFAAIGRK